jgi:hypothetical protein
LRYLSISSESGDAQFWCFIRFHQCFRQLDHFLRGLDDKLTLPHTSL